MCQGLLEGLRGWLVGVRLDNWVGLGKWLGVVRLGGECRGAHWSESLSLWVIHGIVIPVVLGRNWRSLCMRMNGRSVGLVIR